MEFLTSSPYDVAFQTQLEAIAPGLSGLLAQADTLPAPVAHQAIAALLGRACQAQHIRNIELGHEAAAEMPRLWLVREIEAVAARTLNLHDEWEFRRLLELYQFLNPQLLSRLIAQGLQSRNPEIAGAAREFSQGVLD